MGEMVPAKNSTLLLYIRCPFFAFLILIQLLGIRLLSSLALFFTLYLFSFRKNTVQTSDSNTDSY